MAQKRKRNKRWIFWIVMAILFVVAVVVCYFVWDTYFRDKKDEEKPVEEYSLVEEKKDNNDKNIEEEIIEKEKEKEQVVAYEGEDPNIREELTGVVTYTGVNSDTLMIRVNIDQYLAGGSCELSLMQNGVVVYSDTAGIITAATTATCEGFNVPVSGLGVGNYQILIRLSSDGKTGTINGEVSI